MPIGDICAQIKADPKLSQTRVVLLTSMDRHGHAGRFSSLGFAGCLTKPVRPRALLACLDQVLDGKAKESHSKIPAKVNSNGGSPLSTAPRFRGRVLLVEDNAVNQKVARRFLERLGCTVTVADNGQSGIEAYETNEFDLILMDINMPVMDGYASAKLIRQMARGTTRVPIIALTANAMTGQLERSLAAGMDGLLTKPIVVDHLREVLRRAGLAVDEMDLRTT